MYSAAAAITTGVFPARGIEMLPHENQLLWHVSKMTVIPAQASCLNQF